MFSNNGSDSSNLFDRATRPGTLLALLIIGFGLVYILTNGAGNDPSMADGMEDDPYIVIAEAEDDVLPEDESEDLLQNDEVLIAVAEEPDTSEPEDAEMPVGEDLQDSLPEDDTLPEDDGVEEVMDDQMPVGEEVTAEEPEDYEPEDYEPEEEEILEEEIAAADDEDEGRHRECIYVPGIDGFHVIDDRHLTVRTSPQRIYLVTLFNRCRQLNWTHRIAIKSYSSWTCSYSRDVIIANDDRCIIDDIERVSSNEEAEEIVAERTGSD